MSYLLDQLLAWLQRHCNHPGDMLVADILESSSADTEVTYCRRCGAVMIKFHPMTRGEWRLPDPNLWRGK